MITSIVVKDKYTIGMNSSRKIKLGDNVLSVDKEVPFIRYRFSTYADTEFTYINNMMQTVTIHSRVIIDASWELALRLADIIIRLWRLDKTYE